jgi:hypothetical protein
MSLKHRTRAPKWSKSTLRGRAPQFENLWLTLSRILGLQENFQHWVDTEYNCVIWSARPNKGQHNTDKQPTYVHAPFGFGIYDPSGQAMKTNSFDLSAALMCVLLARPLIQPFKVEWLLHVPAALKKSVTLYFYLWVLYDSHYNQRLFP